MVRWDDIDIGRLPVTPSAAQVTVHWAVIVMVVVVLGVWCT